MPVFGFDLDILLRDAALVSLAFALAFPVGWERREGCRKRRLPQRTGDDRKHWNAGAIGGAVGFGRANIVVILCAINLASLWLPIPLSKSPDVGR